MKNTEDLREKTLASEEIFKGTLLHIKKDTVELPNKSMATREWVVHPGASAILPMLADGRVILVKQYRHPLGRITLEIPAGKLDNKENPLDCAKRELSEETGYISDNLRKLGVIATTVGFSNEYVHLYLANSLTAGEAHTDEDEFVNTVFMPWEELLAKVIANEIVDAKTIVAVLMAQQYINRSQT